MIISSKTLDEKVKASPGGKTFTGYCVQAENIQNQNLFLILSGVLVLFVTLVAALGLALRRAFLRIGFLGLFVFAVVRVVIHNTLLFQIWVSSVVTTNSGRARFQKIKFKPKQAVVMA
jgi:hypothetical protein